MKSWQIGSVIAVLLLVVGMVIYHPAVVQGLVTLGFIALGVYALMPLWAWTLANMDICFTFYREGTAKAIMHGEKAVDYLIKKRGHKILRTDEEVEIYARASVPVGPTQPGKYRRWDVVPLLSGEKEEEPGKWYERISGAKFYGFWPFYSIYRYQFNWVVLVQKGEKEGDVKTITRERNQWVDSIFLKDTVYYGQVRGVQSGGDTVGKKKEKIENLPIDIEYLLTVRVFNPDLALFSVHRWLDSTLDLVNQRGRQYVGTKRYDQLVAEEGDDPSIGFSGGIQKLEDNLRLWGIEFVFADIARVRLSGQYHGEYEKASTTAYTAKQEATKKVTDATAEARRIRLVGDAEADALTKRMKAFEENPTAARATLNADVGKALNLGVIAEQIGKMFPKQSKGGK